MIYFTAHTFKCVCHCRRAMFTVLGMYNFGKNLKIRQYCSKIIQVPGTHGTQSNASPYSMMWSPHWFTYSKFQITNTKFLLLFCCKNSGVGNGETIWWTPLIVFSLILKLWLEKPKEQKMVLRFICKLIIWAISF